MKKGKVAVLSTWNQECGLATYARYMVAPFPKGSFLVLAEESNTILANDEDFVRRCWHRERGDYTSLLEIIKAEDVGLLHINGHYRFFHHPAFTDFLEQIAACGVRTVVTLHSAFTQDSALRSLVQNVDCVITHTPEVRLETIANGADPDRVIVIAHGVDVRPPLNRAEQQAVRASLGMSADDKVLVSFGFIQPHKGMDAVIASVLGLQKHGIKAHGYIAGKVNEADPNSQKYRDTLGDVAQRAGVGDQIHFLDRFLSEQEVIQYLQAADLVLMNYQSQHYEASGACSLAIGAGALVATSVAPAFASFGDAVWHMTSGYPADSSAALLMMNEQLANDIRQNAQQYCAAFSWEQIFEQLTNVYTACGVELQSEVETMVAPRVEQISANIPVQESTLSVLIQNRSNALTQSGGDTIVMRRLLEQLTARGVHVVLDLEGTQNPSDFDLVHLFNFATASLTEQFAKVVENAGVPFVVTTLCEDAPGYRNQAMHLAGFLIEYVERGQNPDWYQAAFPDLLAVEPAQRFPNDWTVKHAAALLTNGLAESRVLQRDYGQAIPVKEVPLGFDRFTQADPELFVRQYGVRDFILCVGRLEFRKNQLMLLKALEDSDVPIVLAAGGFSYDERYANAVKNFNRRGRTIITDRLSNSMLASAFAAAKVHALPSWYELPGLVSLEAAYHGCAVVASNYGTSRNYLGTYAHYCDPAEAASIRAAVDTALTSPLDAHFRTHIEQFTWENMGTQTIAVYESVLNNEVDERSFEATQNDSVAQVSEASTSLPENQTVLDKGGYDLASCTVEFQELLERGELAAKNKEYNIAHDLLFQAEQLNPHSVRALRARGAVYLAEGQSTSARRYFERAFELDEKDPKTLSGLGMVYQQGNETRKAYECYVQALEQAPDSLVAILQLLECSYQLEKYDDLVRVLRVYTQENPEDIEMHFCLAGALFKQGILRESKDLLEIILTKYPTHEGAQQLSALIKETESDHDGGVVEQESANVSLAAQIEASSEEQDASETIDMEIEAAIARIEEAKRQRKYDSLEVQCEALLSQTRITAEQKVRVQCLAAELKVLGGDFVKAKEMFEDILEHFPQSARAYSGLGAITATAAQWVDAERYFKQALSCDANYDVALAGLGLCAAAQNERETAWEYYHAALEQNPENSRALLGVLEIGYPERRFAAIEGALTRYMDLHPGDIEFLYSLAGCYFVQGKVSEASEALERLTLLDPEHEGGQELAQMIAEQASGARPNFS